MTPEAPRDQEPGGTQKKISRLMAAGIAALGLTNADPVFAEGQAPPQAPSASAQNSADKLKSGASLKEVKNFVRALLPDVKKKGYTMKDLSLEDQMKFQFYFQGKCAGMIYTSRREPPQESEVHIVGHFDAGDHELKTQFLEYPQVTRAVILSSFK